MNPITRREKFMAAAASGDTSLTPITREEYFLSAIAQSVADAAAAASPLFVDTEYHDVDGLTGYFKTDTLATEIEEAYKAGRTVLIHFPKVVTDVGGDECLFRICGWMENGPYLDEAPFSVAFAGLRVGNGRYYSYIRLKVTDDGYLAFYIFTE